MPTTKVDIAIVVGAGFSHYAGLPLTNKFTEAILEARKYKRGPSRITVDFLSKFVRETFGHSSRASAKHWPDLEDMFTCVDLSANFGHHLGSKFAPADLRSVRRALLSRIMRMLDQKYQGGRRRKGLDWWKLDNFFSQVASRNVGFLSMNWDTVIERKLEVTKSELLIDYGCDARPAAIPNVPTVPTDEEKRYLKLKRTEVERGQVILLGTQRQVDEKKLTPLVKIHGSINWLYCDSCRQLFWFHPDESKRIANQLIREDDLLRISEFISAKKEHVQRTLADLRRTPPVLCPCSDTVRLGTRIATFSYRKALDFPMFQKSWFAVEQLLLSANRWVFIGYSLPAADYEFKYLLKRTQLSRKNKPEIIVVSGGKKGAVRKTYDNYHRFFGGSVVKARFLGSGLTRETVEAICN